MTTTVSVLPVILVTQSLECLRPGRILHILDLPDHIRTCRHGSVCLLPHQPAARKVCSGTLLLPHLIAEHDTSRHISDAASIYAI